MARIDKLLRRLKDDGGSDLHLAAGLEPRMRARGELVPIEGEPVLRDDGVRDLMREIVDDTRWS